VKVLITYTKEIEVEIEDIEDYTLTEKEISIATVKELERVKPLEYNGFEWEWEWVDKKPKAIVAIEGIEPPSEEYWMNVRGGYCAATNGVLLVIKDRPIAGLKLDRGWLLATNEISKALGDILTKDFSSMPLSKAVFDNQFKALKDIKGIEAHAEDEYGVTYLLVDGLLIGGLMPLSRRENGCFSFHD